MTSCWNLPVADLRSLLRRIDVSAEDVRLIPRGNGVLVEFKNGRQQFIGVEDCGPHQIATSVVIGAARVDRIGRPQALARAWQRNRHTDLIAFGLDRKGRLVGRVDLLASHLDPNEAAFALLQLARETDWLQHILTGTDSSSRLG